MKIKEVQAGVKLTRNYDSYQASLTAELGAGENPEKIMADLFERVYNLVLKKINSVKKNYLGIQKSSEIEVGAAWFDKKSKDKLNIKDSDTGKWSELSINDLEKIKGGYTKKTEDGDFIFKKIPENKRKNNKMPIFRIYKIKNRGGELHK